MNEHSNGRFNSICNMNNSSRHCIWCISFSIIVCEKLFAIWLCMRLKFLFACVWSYTKRCSHTKTDWRQNSRNEHKKKMNDEKQWKKRGSTINWIMYQKRLFFSSNNIFLIVFAPFGIRLKTRFTRTNR